MANFINSADFKATTIYALVDPLTNKELELVVSSGNKSSVYVKAINASENAIIQEMRATDDLRPEMRVVEVINPSIAANPQARKLANQKDAERLQERVSFWSKSFEIGA